MLKDAELDEQCKKALEKLGEKITNKSGNAAVLYRVV